MIIPESFIKNITLQLDKGYKFDNTPLSLLDNSTAQVVTNPSSRESNFIGRKQLISKFLEFLRSSSQKGIFLVTGFRGMGKTSFVNHVLNKYMAESNDKKIIPIHLTIAQNNPKEADILRLIVTSVYDKYLHYLADKNRSKKGTLKKKNDIQMRLLIGAIFFLIPIMVIWKPQQIQAFIDNGYGFNKSPEWGLDFIKWFSYFLFPGCFCFLVYQLYLYIDTKFKESVQKRDMELPDNRIKNLYERCHSSLTEETSNEDSSNIQAISRFFITSEKRTKQYPIASTKEIEYELHQFFNSARLEFIIVFDELDKVDPAISTSYLYDDMESFESKRPEDGYQRELRDRKQAIINIISGLKNFFTTASARFIFIAGREMFDASLADIADRQSSISSIFTYVFNVDSLLKEKELGSSNNNNASLSNAIEDYLKTLFIGSEDDEDNIFPKPEVPEKSGNDDKGTTDHSEGKTEKQNDEESKPATDNIKDNKTSDTQSSPIKEAKVFFNVKKVHELEFFDLIRYKCLQRGKTDEEFGKIYFILQNFVTYLIYRSNGSPKKLIKAIQEFIVIKKISEIAEEKNILLLTQDRHKSIADDRKMNKDEVEETYLFLYFNYHNQYRIGFISYLYRPFLIQYGRSFKLYSDNIILSTPYLFDHLLKFHPFAFSLTNLELIPEVLSTNKTPYLREHVKQIISHLRNNHVRDTDVELFDFKFYSRTMNEIKFISKVFEQEAAAFNFTLDESYLVILQIRSKIKELRSIYSKFLGDDKTGQQIFSIAHLNGILGDLHFFNQEYDDAIVAYSDAIRPINHLDVSSMNMRDFITLIRNKLKLGLCFEKISSYEEALAFYSDSSMDANRFILYRIEHAENISTHQETDNDVWWERDGYFAKEGNHKQLYQTSSMNDVLQIIIQCFMAKMIVQEKMGVQGISFPKLSIAFGTFLTLANRIEQYSDRNHLIVSNAYLIIGKLLYFKNSQKFSDFDDEAYSTAALNYPPDIREKILPLYVKFNTGLDQSITPLEPGHSRRKPVFALYFYIIGMCEVVSSRNVKNGLFDTITREKGPANIVYELLEELSGYLDQKDERLVAFHYRYIATFLSNIGDCLLSMYIVEKRPTSSRDQLPAGENKKYKRYNEIRLEDLFNIELAPDKIKNDYKDPDHDKLVTPIKFEHYLKASKEDQFTLSDVLKCYYLSAKYFQIHGRTVSSSFQYRKILHVLRLVLTKESNATDFLSILQRTIVEPILDIISQNSGNSDRHMNNKAQTDFKIENTFAINNISNHPESREVMLLYNYIRIKVSVEPIKLLNIINPHYSIATQYARILELDLYSKLVYRDNKISLFDSDNDLEKHKKVAIQYLFSMLSILRVLTIYNKDYMLGLSFVAYTHYRIAKFLSGVISKKAWQMAGIKDELDNLMGRGSYSSMDILYHFRMANDFYQKAIYLHTAGSEYKKTISGMIYLEDDFNDNAYHFGAALDRYMMTNDVFSDRITECCREIQILSSTENKSLFA